MPPPFWILATQVPEYHHWVKEGGLNKFAERYSLDASFIERIDKVPTMTLYKYRDELNKIPQVHEYITTTKKAWEQKRVPWTGAEAQELMRLAEGSSSDEADEADEDSQEQTVSQKAQQ